MTKYGDRIESMLNSYSLRQKLGLLCGPSLFLLVLMMPLPDGMTVEAQRVAALALLMACFWMAETVPIPVTAMLPIFMFPVLGVLPTSKVTVAYGNHILFLFMGGFLIAVAMQKWQLHRRIALNIIAKLGSSPQRLLLGFMLSTALLSMWISNTATAMMMMPVALAVIEQNRQDSGAAEGKFGLALMLAIAYSASIGGVATLVGTPPNAIFIGIIETLYAYEISFFDWMLLGVPISVSMLLMCWWVLSRLIQDIDSNAEGALKTESKGLAHQHIVQELDDMGPISMEESRVASVFAMVALAWILRGLFKPEALSMVSDSAIAMAGAFVLFALPASKAKGGFILDWKTAATIPWDIIILMGGGFALAAGFSESGLTQWLAGQLSILEGVNVFIVILAAVFFVTFLTEITSNAATATLFIPVMGALAISMNMHPFTLMVPSALAASMAFMLPVATPPNAIVFASRQVSIGQMASTGFILNIAGGILVSVLSYLLLPVLL